MLQTTPRSITCHRAAAVLGAVTVAVLAAGCRSNAAPPAPAVSPDTWATVDGREIKRDDVDKAYRRVGQGAAGPRRKKPSTPS